MLIGEYIHTIDAKNRVSFPAKFRKEMGKKVVITPGLEQCLFIFTTKEWEKVAKKLRGGDGELSFLKKDQRTFNRMMFGQASEVELDAIGRILVPDFLKERAKLGASVALVGVEDRVEVWNEKVWKEYKVRADKEAEIIAEKLAGSA